MYLADAVQYTYASVFSNHRNTSEMRFLVSPTAPVFIFLLSPQSLQNGMMRPWFQCPDSSLVMTFLSKSGCSLNVLNIFWAVSMLHWFSSKLSNFGTIFAATRFMPKTFVRIASHEWNNMATSSETSLIVLRRLFKIIFFTASIISPIVEQWWDLQFKVDSERFYFWRFLRNFSRNFYLLSEFLTEICWEEAAKQIFCSYFV